MDAPEFEQLRKAAEFLISCRAGILSTQREIEDATEFE
jgi:hypothetical protein